MKIKLSEHFGEPADILKRLERNKPQYVGGLVPGYYASTYRDAIEHNGMDSGQLHTAYADRKFENSLFHFRVSYLANRSIVYLVHAPATANHNFSTQHAFEELVKSFADLNAVYASSSRGVVLPVFAVTRGKSYTVRMDHTGVKYKIEEEGYDPTEVAIDEGRKLGVLTVVMGQDTVHQQIKELMAQISSGQKPSSALA